jgi:hypothetical protein
MAGDLSTGTTIIANLTVGGGGFGFGGFGGAVGGGNSNATAYGRLDLKTNRAVLSMWTRGVTSGMTAGDLRLVLQASGLSLIYSSGASIYDLGVSNTSAVQS